MTKKGTKKSEKAVEHPCRFLEGCKCTNPDMVMWSERYQDPESKAYHTIPERADCVACLLANLLVQLRKYPGGAAFLKGRE